MRKIIIAITVWLIIPTTIASAAFYNMADNLQKAYHYEVNTRAKYDAYAARAEEEGRATVASLFRACEKSSEIMMTNYSNLLYKRKQRPITQLMHVSTKSTLENLAESLRSANDANQTMFRPFSVQAEYERDTPVFWSFRWGMYAATERAKYFLEALLKSEQWREGKKQFIVCPACGYVTAELWLKRCPICNYSRAQMLEIS